MKEDFIIGVDLGTTSSRAGIFDLEGKMLGGGYYHSCPYLNKYCISTGSQILFSFPGP